MTTDQQLYSMLRRDAESSYSSTSAALYRQSDDLGKESVTHSGKCEIIRDLSSRFSEPITMLDLGCGTGRYFHCAKNVRRLIGVDPSQDMLMQARAPVMGGNRDVRLIRSTLHEVSFAPQTFELAICIGVLGLWCPVEELVLRRVAKMLKHNGIFFFSAIEYLPVPMTVKRRVASAIRPLLFGAPRRFVDFKLRQFTISEQRVRDLAQRYFEQMKITKWQSPTMRVDLHCVLSQPRPVQQV